MLVVAVLVILSAVAATQQSPGVAAVIGLLAVAALARMVFDAAAAMGCFLGALRQYMRLLADSGIEPTAVETPLVSVDHADSLEPILEGFEQ
jgi:hypothetical protein